MVTALTEEYNPIHNYDRHEDERETDTGTRTETDTGTRTEAEAEDIADTAADTTTGQATGFNTEAFADDKKTLSTGTGTRDRDVSRTETRNLSHGEQRNLANSRTLHAYGNIGVTTSADMIEQELAVRKNDVLNLIKDEFTAYFCLRIY